MVTKAIKLMPNYNKLLKDPEMARLRQSEWEPAKVWSIYGYIDLSARIGQNQGDICFVWLIRADCPMLHL